MPDCCSDLNIVVSRAVFHISGSTPFLSDSLKMIARLKDQFCSINIFEGILPGPDDFESFSPLRTVSAHCFLTDWNQATFSKNK